MIKLDHLIFGYYRVEINERDKQAVLNLFLEEKIPISFESNNVFTICARNLKHFERAIDNKIQYKLSELKGLYSVFRSNRKRYGLFAGVFVVILLYLWLSGFVWDVRIEGSESGCEDKVIAELADCGLCVGARWRKIDKNKVEINLLSVSDSVSWININRRGCVAYVTVADKTTYEEQEKNDGYASVISAVDCIIEEITVERGVAMVKVGDSVKKGQVLISGVIPTELGGGCCYAEGNVVGRFSDYVSVKISEKTTEKVYGRMSIESCYVEFFGFSINIFKKYGNLSSKCDIIEKKENLKLFCGKKLPISVTKSYVMPYYERQRTLSCDEMTKSATRLLNDEIAFRTKERDIIRIKTEGDFTDFGYVMSAALVCRGNVGQIREFEVQRS